MQLPGHSQRGGRDSHYCAHTPSPETPRIPGVRVGAPFPQGHCSLASLQVEQLDNVFFKQSRFHIGHICSYLLPLRCLNVPPLTGLFHRGPFVSRAHLMGEVPASVSLGAECPFQRVFLFLLIPW